MANRITAPEAFSDAIFTATNVVINDDAIAAPDGTVTADRMNVAAVSNIHRIYATPASLGTGSNVFLSVFYKDDGAGGVILSCLGNSVNGFAVAARFSDNTIYDTWVGGTSGTVVSSQVEDYGNGWYRLSVIGSFSGGNTFIQVGSSDGSTAIAAGTINHAASDGDDLYAWGLYADFGSGVIPYVSVGGTTVTPASSGSARHGPGLSFGMMGKLGAA